MYQANKKLTQALIDLNLGYPIAFENADFEPPEQGAWLSAHYLPVSNSSLMKDEFGLDEFAGIYQVSIYMPSGSGSGEAQRTADTIIQWFKHGRYVDDVLILESTRNSGRSGSGWYIIDVSINFTVDLQRV